MRQMLVAILILAAAATAPAASAPGSDSSKASWNAVRARVALSDDVMITEHDLTLFRRQLMMLVQVQEKDAERRKAQLKQLAEDDLYVLAQLLRKELELQEATRLQKQYGAQFDDVLVDRMVEQELQKFGGSVALSRAGMTRSQFRELIVEREKRRWWRMMRDKNTPRITPAEVKKAYEDRHEQFQSDAALKLRLLVLSAADTAIEQARSLRQQAADGANFAELCREHAAVYRESGGRIGGDKGFVSISALSQTVRDAVAELRAPAVSPVIEDGPRLVIVKLEDRRDAGIQPLEEVYDELEAQLKKERQREADARIVRDLFAKARITDAENKPIDPRLLLSKLDLAE